MVPLLEIGPWIPWIYINLIQTPLKLDATIVDKSAILLIIVKHRTNLKFVLCVDWKDTILIHVTTRFVCR